MESKINYFLILFIIFFAFDYSICKPIAMDDMQSLEINAVKQEVNLKTMKFRPQRQVVQPTWLQGKSDNRAPTGKQSVKVTDQNLKEAAELRALIQDAVDNDKFAVRTDGMQPANTPDSTNKNDQPTPMPFKLPDEWNVFQFFGLSDQQGEQQVEFVGFWDEVQRMWSDITENYIQHIVKEINWFQQS